MNTDWMRNGRKWSLYGVLLAPLVYSALTLNSVPAYALGGDQCTTQECSSACFSVICPLHRLMWVLDQDTCNYISGSVLCVCSDSQGHREQEAGPCS